MKNQPEKLMNGMYQGIIIDPTVFNDRERLRSFLDSMLSKKYRNVITSDIYFLIRDGNWDELSELLQNWEWNRSKKKLIEWHKNKEFIALCKDVIGVVVPCTRILEELNNEERNVLQKIFQIIEPSSPRMVKLAKELIMTSVVKKFPILSYSKHAKRWFKNCKNVLIIEITDAKNTLSKAKSDIKMRVSESGWKGFIELFVFGVVVDKALENALPQPVGSLVGYISGGSFIVGVLVNGKKMKD